MEENYADVYYVDTRNADSRDHRTGSSGSTMFGGLGRPPAASPTRTVVSPNGGFVMGPAGGFVRQPAYPAGYPAGYPSPYPTYPGQAFPQMYPGQTALGNLFGGMPVGQILDLVATAFAALAPLPTAPLATKDTVTDVGNLMLYQGALAEHAKRDERIRTIGSLVGKLVA